MRLALGAFSGALGVPEKAPIAALHSSGRSCVLSSQALQVYIIGTIAALPFLTAQAANWAGKAGQLLGSRQSFLLDNSLVVSIKTKLRRRAGYLGQQLKENYAERT